ncbi:MAG: hypothetical protein DRN08_06970, partial [Thermoplasmata archaeon]
RGIDKEAVVIESLVSQVIGGVRQICPAVAAIVGPVHSEEAVIRRRDEARIDNVGIAPGDCQVYPPKAGGRKAYCQVFPGVAAIRGPDEPVFAQSSDQHRRAVRTHDQIGAPVSGYSGFVGDSEVRRPDYSYIACQVKDVRIVRVDDDPCYVVANFLLGPDLAPGGAAVIGNKKSVAVETIAAKMLFAGTV